MMLSTVFRETILPDRDGSMRSFCLAITANAPRYAGKIQKVEPKKRVSRNRSRLNPPPFNA